MAERIDTTQVLRDCEKLGIINIQASGDLTPSLAEEAVQAVKEINLDFKEFARLREAQRMKNSK